MGQKINPVSLRMGITETWQSKWYADKSHFGDRVVEDEKIRRFIKNNYDFAGVSRIDIERGREEVSVIVHSARPGLLIGRRGSEVERLQANLQEISGQPIEISIEEVSSPELNAQLVAEDTARELERRSAFRRTLKNMVEMVMDAGALGAKIQVKGRLGGAEIARSVSEHRGSIPLHTFKAKISYGFTEANTKYGSIGVKVWINNGYLAPGAKSPEEEEDGKDAQQG